MIFALFSFLVAIAVGLSTAFFVPLSVWDALNMVGPTLVLMGIWREFWLLINKLPKDATSEMERKMHVEEVIAVWIVILGVGIELVVVPHSMVEVAALKLETKNVETTNAALWQTNFVLRKDLAELNLKIQPRIITPEQVTNFIFLTEKIKKIPIVVSIYQEGFDTENFAFQLRMMLSKAGFTTNAQAGLWGIKREPSKLIANGIGYEVVNADLIWLLPSDATVTNVASAKHVFIEESNGFKRPSTDSTNEDDIYTSVVFALMQTGIKVRAIHINGWDVSELYVPMKNQF